jgi:hypothetical protein
LVELRTELRAELSVLKFVTWVPPQFTARGFVFNQSKPGLAKFEITRKYNVFGKYPGHASKLATLKPHQKLENLYFNILTTT